MASRKSETFAAESEQEFAIPLPRDPMVKTCSSTCWGSSGKPERELAALLAASPVKTVSGPQPEEVQERKAPKTSGRSAVHKSKDPASSVVEEFNPRVSGNGRTKDGTEGKEPASTWEADLDDRQPAEKRLKGEPSCERRASVEPEKRAR